MLRLVNTDSEMQNKLESLSRQSWRKDKYKWVFGNSYTRTYFPADDTTATECWAVVKDRNPDHIIGYVKVNILHNNFWISCAVNYSDDVITMGNALYDLVAIAINHHYHKIVWSVIDDNPIHHSYQKMCAKLGGRRESCLRDHVRTWDNAYHDVYEYGILTSEIPESVRKFFEKRWEKRKNIMFF